MSNQAALEIVVRAFPGWRRHFIPHAPSPGGDPDEAYIEVPCPANGSGHYLAVQVSGDTMEVSYSDGLGRGPVEAQFVTWTDDVTVVAPTVLEFIRDLIGGQVRVVREPGWFGATGRLVFKEDGEKIRRNSVIIHWREIWE